MRVSLTLNGRLLADWKVDCADCLPDSSGIQTETAFGKIDSADFEQSEGEERILVYKPAEYSYYHGTGSWTGKIGDKDKWTEQLSVTQ